MSATEQGLNLARRDARRRKLALANFPPPLAKGKAGTEGTEGTKGKAKP